MRKIKLSNGKEILIREDFNFKNTYRHLKNLRITLNYLSLVDEMEATEEGRNLVKEAYSIVEKMDNLLKDIYYALKEVQE